MGDVPMLPGDQIRTGYTEDRELKASVIPSGRDARAGGGSYGFDANNPDIVQNIIVCEGGEMRKIAQVTRAQLAEGSPDTATPSAVAGGPPDPAAVEGRAAITEEYYRELAAAKNVPTEDTANPQHAKPEAVVALPVSAPAQVVIPAVYVTIKGPFGKIKQPFSKVFRDGICLVLKVQHDTLPTSYELPELDPGEVMQLTLEIDDHAVQCIWAGLTFTDPGASATFTVLLIQEETDIEEGRLR